MDQNKQNQSIDGFKPVVDNNEAAAPPRPVDGFRPAATGVPVQTHTDQNIPEPRHEAPEKTNTGTKPAKSGKAVKVWLVIMSLLFVVGVAASAYFYMQNAQTQDALDAKTAELTQLQQQTSTSQQQIDELKAENAELSKQVEDQQAYIAKLFKAASDLKTKCGGSCSALVVPPVPTTPPATTTTP